MKNTSFVPLKAREPMSLMLGAPGRTILEYLLTPGFIFIEKFTLDTFPYSENLAKSAETKEDVYVYQWYEDLDSVLAEGFRAYQLPLTYWAHTAIIDDSGVPQFRHIDWRPGFAKSKTHTVLLKQVLNNQYFVLRIDTAYSINDVDDDYMPYSTMVFHLYQCQDTEDQDRCLDDLTFERYLTMFEETLPFFNSAGPEAQSAFSAFQQVWPKAFSAVLAVKESKKV